MDFERGGFSDSNEISYNSSSIYSASANNMEIPSTFDSMTPETESLFRLSDSIGSIFYFSTESDFFSDAKIVSSDGKEVSVHRCILAVRSAFFKAEFERNKERGVKLELKKLANEVSIGLDALKVVLGFMYCGKLKPLPKGACDCVDAECSHLGCRPSVEFLVQVLYASFKFQISELVALYQRRLLDILDNVAVDDVLLVLSAAIICDNICEKLKDRCIDTIIRSDIDAVTLEKSLPLAMVRQIVNTRKQLGIEKPECITFPDKHVKRIHSALDSDDVELVRLLLNEARTTLDDANALHYAVSYCNAKTTAEILDLGIADVNRRNPRGYTVLHVAAMRKEPKIIVSLLTKGARPYDVTPDGRKALQICRRMTKVRDYLESPENGKDSPKDKLCVEILEQAERPEPLLGEASFSLAIAGDNLRMRLLYLENRVALARLLFPTEAGVVMEIAQADVVSKFPFHSIRAKFLAVSPGASVDLNEAPYKIQDDHLKRILELSRTVELGKRFFPRCSHVLDKIMDQDDIEELAQIERGSSEERLLKRQKFMEYQELFSEAFHQDKEEFERFNIASSAASSSSSSIGMTRSKRSSRPNHKQ